MRPGFLRGDHGHRRRDDRRNHPWADHRYRHLAHHRDGLRRHLDDHGHLRVRRDGRHVWEPPQLAPTAAWASSPDWGEACPVRRRRGAACGHWVLRHDGVLRGRRGHPRDDSGDAAVFPCPAKGRRGCCPDAGRLGVVPGRGWGHQDATARDEQRSCSHLRSAGSAPAYLHSVCWDGPQALPDGLPVWVPVASARALRRAWAQPSSVPGRPQVQRAWLTVRG